MNNLSIVTPPMKKFMNIFYLLSNLVNSKYKSIGVVAVLRIYVFNHCSSMIHKDR